MKILFSLLLLLVVSCQQTPVKTSKPFIANEIWGTLKGDAHIEKVEVILIPQWHLGPSIDTKSVYKEYPQAINQHAIYNQLVKWVESGQIKSVIVEGCTGEIKQGFEPRFNGWSLQDVMDAEDKSSVLTQVGLRLEAQFGEKLKVLCGDDVELIKKNLLAFSDLKGLFGYKTRIDQFKTQPVRQKSYIDSARSVLKMDSSASDEEVLKKINEELLKSLSDFKSLLNQRNDSILKTIKKVDFPAAVVIGALHIEDLQDRLKDKNTLVFEPVGLKGDEVQLIEVLEKALKN